MVYNNFHSQSVWANCRLDVRPIAGRCCGKVILMLFRPSFCANCGEAIDRVDWGLLTSRRFCPVCESEFKGLDLIPRVIVGAGVLVGILGLGSYCSSGPATDPSRLMQAQRLVQRPVAEVGTQGRNTGPAANVAATFPERPPTPEPKMSATVRPVGQPSLKGEVVSAQYFCGAETKKGTPCSRRVKGHVRCYQHVGMPAMVSADKLKVN